ncbi:flagellar filament capping protein FliD [Exiguobacterium sp. s161]|uniref:flagellar filament capping protein FliD n=1 Tax=Exiguobacterium sp. s161 TaxID=2751191 RepID=UPI001BE6C481|nr:flagellar filament capping protein FliD [Exiguobacterium sp. s161]
MANIRLSGLASGIDTESMIKQLMQAERAPVDRLSQKKQTLTWQRDAYREMNRALLDLRTAASDMLLSKNYSAKSVVSSNSNVLSVTANSTAATGSITIDRIDRLATPASLTISQGAPTTPPISTTTMLKDSQLLGIDSATKQASLELQTYAADGSKTVKTVTLHLDETATIGDLVNQINGSKELGLSAVFNDLTGKLVLSRQATGQLNTSDEIKWTDQNASALTTLPAQTAKAGANASYQIGGTSLEQTSNTFVQNGLTITLNNTTTSPTTLTTKLDTQTNFDTIKKFVDKYNDLIDKMNKKVREEKFRDYQPLTDAQRKELSEDEVKKWEEKAMSGVLKNDPLLRDGINDFRSTLSAKIDTDYTIPSASGPITLNSLSQIGITTTSDFRDGGKIKLDETKLKEMLEKHPDSVYRLFTVEAPQKVTQPDGTEIKNPDGLSGFIRQIQAFTTTLRDKVSSVAGRDGSVATTYRLGKSLADIDKSMLSWEDKLKRKEDSYYRRFAAMEQAMNQANSQSATLTNYLTQGQ